MSEMEKGAAEPGVDCDGGSEERTAEEPVVSLAEVLAENEELEKEARAVLGGSDHERCSYSQVRVGEGVLLRGGAGRRAAAPTSPHSRRGGGSCGEPRNARLGGSGSKLSRALSPAFPSTKAPPQLH